MDADLQNDIHAIGKMLLAYEARSDLVLGVGSDRTSDNVTKRGTAGACYKSSRFWASTSSKNTPTSA